MRVITGIPQGSAEWLHIRAGVPSASCFDKIITPARLELSESRFGYMNHLLAERMLNCPLAETFEDGSMERGKMLEPEAKSWFAFETGHAIEDITFVECKYEIPLTGAVRYGCSPDGMADRRKRVVEIKNHGASKHMNFLAASLGWRGQKLEAKHRVQVQGQILCCGVEYADICAYHPTLPKVIVTVTREEEFVQKAQPVLEQFCIELETKWEKLREMYGPFEWPNRPAQPSEFISDADVEAIIAARKAEAVQG